MVSAVPNVVNDWGVNSLNDWRVNLVVLNMILMNLVVLNMILMNLGVLNLILMNLGVLNLILMNLGVYLVVMNWMLLGDVVRGLYMRILAYISRTFGGTRPHHCIHRG